MKIRDVAAWSCLTAVMAFGVAACGGDDDSDSGEQGTTAGTPAEGKKGGKLTVLSGGDVDFLDPGKTYYVYTIGILNALDRGLYAYLPQCCL